MIAHENKDYHVLKTAEYSEWSCCLFGGTPADAGLKWKPQKGRHPNFFWRWMQYICFGNYWFKDK